MMVISCVGLLTFTSCEKEGIDETVSQNSNSGVDGPTSSLQTLSQNSKTESTTETEDLFCFSIDYPIEVVYPDGTTTSVAADEEFLVVVEEWYDVEEEVEDLSLNFPISVTLEDGDQETINDDEDFEDLIDDCFDEYYDDYEDEYYDEEGCFDDFDPCFDLVYPVTIIFPDGTTNVVNDDDELEDVIDAFYDANEDVEEDPTFDYPITVTLDDGEEIINSDDELETLYDECEEYWEDEYYEECFDLVFPITAQLPDGTSITANDEDELYDAIDAFYDANQDVEEDPTLVYPISVAYDDGTTATANSDDELDALYEGCE